jgi:hypothetical protein
MFLSYDTLIIIILICSVLLPFFIGCLCCFRPSYNTSSVSPSPNTNMGFVGGGDCDDGDGCDGSVC